MTDSCIYVVDTIPSVADQAGALKGRLATGRISLSAHQAATGRKRELRVSVAILNRFTALGITIT
jgi:hypothetical protein